jgi:hypothetical protein
MIQRSETMTGKVEILEKVIKECELSLPELHDLLSKVDSLFWDEANKQTKELTK